MFIIGRSLQIEPCLLLLIMAFLKTPFEWDGTWISDVVLREQNLALTCRWGKKVLRYISVYVTDIYRKDRHRNSRYDHHDRQKHAEQSKPIFFALFHIVAPVISFIFGL